MCNNSVQNSSYCGPYTLNDVTSQKQFALDYAHAIGKYTEGFRYPKEIHKTPSLEMLLSFAEKEFEKEFSKRPTHAVYAPAHVNLCGEKTDFNDGKVLAMVKRGKRRFLATQLVTVIVGTRRSARRRCKVKTLSREIREKNYREFYLNSAGLDTSQGPSWVNYLKAVVRSFSIPKGTTSVTESVAPRNRQPKLHGQFKLAVAEVMYGSLMYSDHELCSLARLAFCEYSKQIPGFKALIISSIPIKSGLGSSSALTVAAYTFLEAITNVHTLNNLEKSIACQQAEKICREMSCGVGETLLSVVGVEGQVMEFDPRTLQVKEHDWKACDIDLILVNSTQETIDTMEYQKYLNQCREVAFALNLTSLRDATIPKLLIVDQIFSSKLIERARHIISETNRVTKSVELIEQRRWKELGTVMWESHCSMRDNFASSCVQVEYIMGAIQNIDGVYGARIIGRGYGGCVLVMVNRKALKEMTKALSRVAECQEYQVIRPSPGAGILYTDGNDRPFGSLKRSRCDNKANSHHLIFGDYESYEMHHDAIYGFRHDKSFTPLKAISVKTL